MPLSTSSNFAKPDDAFRAVVEALVGQAERAGDALMPSYTHFRPAQPVLVSHFLLAHAAPLTIGLNCALGPAELRQYVKELSDICEGFVSVHPNAGLPNGPSGSLR